jgi:hypothetical protein
MERNDYRTLSGFLGGRSLKTIGEVTAEDKLSPSSFDNNLIYMHEY